VATKIKTNKKKAPDILDTPVRNTDIEKFITKFKENPVLYCAAAGVVVVCIIAGFAFRTVSQSSSKAAMTKFAQAVETEDPALRATELESTAKGPVAAEAVYMMGEAAFEAKDYDKAKAAFERVRKEFVSSPYVPDAVEGLGAIAENAGQFDQAIASYKEIVEKWPASFAKRRQQMNIARCQEAAGNLKDAIATYKAQAEEFPGSSLEKDAKAALDRLKASNPDLFPKEETKPADDAAKTPDAKPADDAAKAPETAQPAEKPAEEKPAEPAAK